MHANAGRHMHKGLNKISCPAGAPDVPAMNGNRVLVFSDSVHSRSAYISLKKNLPASRKNHNHLKSVCVLDFVSGRHLHAGEERKCL